jgi:hypothetical protein
MLKEEQIKQILIDISSKLKSAKESKPENGKWGELYEKATKHAEEIEVHSCGHFPTKLIGANFPGETNEEKDYRRISFQPVTKPYWKKAMRTINRVWAEQNYSIDWAKEDDAKKYFLEDFPIGNDVRQFFKSIVTEAKIADPNGVLAIDFDLPVKQDANGELVIDDAMELQPYATVYESEDVIMFEHNAYCVVLSEEKSVVEYGGRQDKCGFVFYVYDNMNIYRIVQIGKRVDWQFAVSVYYEHALGYLPVWKLKGTPEDIIADEVFYESYFAPALPHLNEAVIIHSTNKSVRNKVSYPTRAYYDQPCTNKDCHSGKVWSDDKENNCSTCGGTGSVKFSPFRDYVHELPTATKDTGKDSVAFPGFAYVSPDGTIIKDNEEVIDKYLETAFLFLNIEVSAFGNSAGLNDPTATKSKIDRDEQYISMLDISNELFHLLQQFINAAYKIRYNSDSPIKIKPPVTFDLISSDELTSQLGKAKTDNIPNMAVSEMTLKLLEQEFGSLVYRKAQIAQYCDVLFVTDNTDISILQTNGNVEKWQVLLHVNFDTFVNELIEEKGDAFEQMELKEVSAILVAKAKAKEAEMNAGKNTATNILKDIATPIEEKVVV